MLIRCGLLLHRLERGKMAKLRPLEIIEQAEFVTIGELVRLTGAKYSTLKHYTEQGMIEFYQAEENLT